MRSISARLLSLLIIAAVFASMLHWTWYTWPDPTVDFGRELYVPWQLLGGKVLYRDIAYFNGPLSPYFNTLVFAVLGVSLRSLVAVNLLLLIAMIAMIWRLWSRIAGEWVATVCCVVLLLVFSFLQLDGVANFNFVTPYSHEITHGVILCFAMISCLAEYVARVFKPCRHGLKTRATNWLIAGGAILGLILLTKIEITIAAVATMAAGLVLIIRTSPRSDARRILASLLLPAVVAPVVAFLLLRMRLPMHEAMLGLLGSWRYAFDSRLADLKFYRYVIGTADIPGSIARIAATFACYLLVCGIAKLAAVIAGKYPRSVRISAAIIFLVISGIAVTLFLTIDRSYWQNSLRGFTILMPLMAIKLFIDAWRNPQDAAAALRAIVAVFATALLAKMPLNVISYHYGFALAMPATLLVVAAALAWLPARFARSGGSALGARAVIVPVIGLFVFVHLFVFARYFSNKTLVVGNGPDAFYADAQSSLGDVRGQAVNEMLHALDHVDPNATLAVIPQGVMVNYLSRRANSTPYIVLMPPEVIMFGVENIRDSFAAHPPGYILLLDDGGRASYEYGVGPFSMDYGKPIAEWMIQHDRYITGDSQNPNLQWLLYQRKH
jgi:hypothetical protein